MEISEIVDRDSFRAWLEDKPEEWAQALAARIALRVAPMAWSIAALSDDQLSKEHREKLTLLTFRASFISSAAAEANYEARAVANAARTAVYATRAIANAAHSASYAARSAANAVYAANATPPRRYGYMV